MDMQPKSLFNYLTVAILVVLAATMIAQGLKTAAVLIDYSDFKQLVEEGHVEDVRIGATMITGHAERTAVLNTLPEATRAAVAERSAQSARQSLSFRAFRVEDPQLPAQLQQAKVRYAGVAEGNLFTTLASWVLPVLFFVAIWWLMLGKAPGRGLGAGDLFGAGKSRARLLVQKNIEVRFTDVEGIDEAKAELMEVVEFLRKPDRYTRLGGHIPKGILIVGAPGTGKTLLAKAVAGEANVPFLLISGSEFVEMFVGVGAARVRDLFHQAVELAPCIIFIDELDALGRARGVSTTSNEEREQTLNQLLVEMDGFDTNKGVIIMAATNRPEILDPALLRPGRFDRHIAIDRPDVRGRDRILRLHAKRLKLAPGVDLASVAAKTAGCAGADLANIVNEAALHAARENKAEVDLRDFDAAIDRAVIGMEKKNRVMNQKEKETVAYHEAGHALIAELRATTDKVSRVSIIPRGIGALGYTQQLPTEDRYLMKHSELLDRLDVLLGGRVAEKLAYGEVSTGAQDDLQRATDLVRHMITQYGMSDVLGAAVLEIRASSAYLGDSGAPARHEFSEETGRRIDAEIQRLLSEAEGRVEATLEQRRPELDTLAAALLRQETVEREFLVGLLTVRPEGRVAAA
jgi:cell division protease FtsH